MFFIIDENKLGYTVNEDTPELLLQITDPFGNVITSLEGLTYKTVTDGKGSEVSGFDITTRTGGFKIAKDYEITTTSEVTQSWSINVVLVNLSSDQSSNGGKKFNGKVLITKDDYETYKLAHINTINPSITPLSIEATLDVTSGTTNISKYYYAIKKKSEQVEPLESEYIESDSTTNKFEGLESETEYTIYTYVKDELGYKSNIYNTDITTTEYVLPKITSVNKSNITNSGATLTITAENGTNGIIKYYIKKSTDASYGSGQTSNVFNLTGLKSSTQYNFNIKVEDSIGKFSTEYDVELTTQSSLLSNHIKSLYTGIQGENNIYYHKNLANSAEDESYRYSGPYKSVNNYVCFGSDDSQCPWDNMYRIIGVFGDQVKLIKADYAKSSELGTSGDYYGTYKKWETDIEEEHTTVGKNTKEQIGAYYWNNSNGTSSTNTWANSNLNNINLNQIYLNKFNSTWQGKIAVTNWIVGGNTYMNISGNTPNVIYQNEIINPVSGQPAVQNKIGIMYIHDYMFAASYNYWTNISAGGDGEDYRSAINDNWMYMGLYDWTITRSSVNTTNANYVSSVGFVVSFHSVNELGMGIRPCFYLNNNITLTGGTGAYSDPYRIS